MMNNNGKFYLIVTLVHRALCVCARLHVYPWWCVNSFIHFIRLYMKSIILSIYHAGCWGFKDECDISLAARTLWPFPIPCCLICLLHTPVSFPPPLRGRVVSSLQCSSWPEGFLTWAQSDPLLSALLLIWATDSC